jgi:hypothetical protein
MFAVISTLSITFWVAISFALLERRDNAQFNVLLSMTKPLRIPLGPQIYSQFLSCMTDFFLSQARLKLSIDNVREHA